MQLTIFDQLDQEEADDLITEKANNLLILLNDGVHKKERYEPHYYFLEKKHIVLIAINRNKDLLFNVIDATNGNVPENFSACWRNWQHIKQELNLN